MASKVLKCIQEMSASISSIQCICVELGIIGFAVAWVTKIGQNFFPARITLTPGKLKEKLFLYL